MDASHRNRRQIIRARLAALTLLGISFAAAGLALASTSAAPSPSSAAGAWRTDPAWDRGEAEWALYDAVRPIYGVDRHYEASLFTNKQRMEKGTTTKARDWRNPAAIEVFKHNLSEIIQTENYAYRFLTTAFVRTEDMVPYKLTMSSQEDCGSTYKQLVVGKDTVTAQQFCYFPGAGAKPMAFRHYAFINFHDALSLTLRDYPFDAEEKPRLPVDLVADQTDTHETKLYPARGYANYVALETVQVPYGTLEAHHIRVNHEPHGGADHTDYWFAADATLRHVMVKYDGPYGVKYELKKLAWAYWDRSQPRPE